MKKKILILSFLFSICKISNGQPNTWNQKADFGGIARSFGIGFSIGAKGYIGLGRNQGQYLIDFWEYDTTTNAWTQKADFSGEGRWQASSFSIGNYGYVGLGEDETNGAVYFNDFWRYDPSLNVWIQKANFPGNPRGQAVGFSIGNKGYFGGGSNINLWAFNDFWEYNPSVDSWSQKANYGGGSYDCAVGFSICNKGYIGTGWDSTVSMTKQFWEWDQASNIWTRKADLTGNHRNSAVGFSIGSNGYIGLGDDSTAMPVRDFWTWNQNTNTWSQVANYGGTDNQEGAVGFVIDNKGYVGTGQFSSELVEFYEFTPYLNTTSIISSNFVADTISGCNPLTMHFTNSSINATSYQWTFGDGDTSSQINPSHIYTTYGTFNVSLIVFGNSICGGILSDTSSLIITVFQTPTPLITSSGPITFCQGDSISLNAGNYSSYSWNTSATTQSITATDSSAYIVTVTDSNGCSGTASIMVSVIPNPNVISAFTVDTLDGCKPLIVHFTNNSINATSYLWKFSGGGTSILTNPIHTYSFSGIDTVTLIAYDSTACGIFTDTSKQTYYFTVFIPPSQPHLIQNGDTLTITNFTTGNQWYENDSIIQGANSASFIVIQTGCYQDIETDTNGCKSKSDTICFAFAGINEISNNQGISIYPNPANTILNIHLLNPQLSTLHSQLIITDVLGNEIYAETLTDIDNSISIAHWSQGVYFYEIRSGNETSRGKFMKIN